MRPKDPRRCPLLILHHDLYQHSIPPAGLLVGNTSPVEEVRNIAVAATVAVAGNLPGGIRSPVGKGLVRSILGEHRSSRQVWVRRERERRC